MPLSETQQQPVASSDADPMKTLPASSSTSEGNENQATITGVVADVEDLEVAVATKGEVLDGQVIEEKPQRRSWPSRFCPSTLRGRACGCCSFLFSLAIVVCVPLFWPKDPTWNLTKITLDEEVLQEYGSLFFAAVENKIFDNATLPVFNLTAEVDLDNPNYMGGTMIAPGDFTVSYKGQDFGWGSCAPATIDARSTTHLVAKVSIRMWPQIFKDIAADVLSNGFNMTVQVTGGTLVRGPLGIQLAAGARCKVHAAVANIYMNETRPQVVDSKECNYHYF